MQALLFLHLELQPGSSCRHLVREEVKASLLPFIHVSPEFMFAVQPIWGKQEDREGEISRLTKVERAKKKSLVDSKRQSVLHHAECNGREPLQQIFHQRNLACQSQEMQWQQTTPG